MVCPAVAASVLLCARLQINEGGQQLTKRAGLSEWVGTASRSSATAGESTPHADIYLALRIKHTVCVVYYIFFLMKAPRGL